MDDLKALRNAIDANTLIQKQLLDEMKQFIAALNRNAVIKEQQQEWQELVDRVFESEWRKDHPN